MRRGTSCADWRKHSRITQKGFQFLINDTETVGSTYLEYDFRKQACINLQNGVHELKDQLHFAIPYVLNPTLFASLSILDRSKFLFDLANLRSDDAEVKEKLLKRNCDPDKVDAVMPFLRSSSYSAEKYAIDQTKEASANLRKSRKN